MSKKTIISFAIIEILGLVVLFAFYKLSQKQISKVSEIESIKKDFIQQAEIVIKNVIEKDVNQQIKNLYINQSNLINKVEQKKEEKKEKKFTIPNDYIITLCNNEYYLYSYVSGTAYTAGDNCPFEPLKKIISIKDDFILLDDNSFYIAYKAPTLTDKAYNQAREANTYVR